MTTRAAIISELTGRIRQLERSQCRAVRDDVDCPECLLPGLGRWLVDSCWPRGGLVEWLFDGDGAGAVSLALLATQTTASHDLAVVIDGRGEFYAPAVAALGIDFRSTVFVRPERITDALWSAEQALRTSGIGRVVCEAEKLSPQAFRRLQLAAETGGSLGVLLRPERVRHQPSWAEYRLLIRPLAMAGPHDSGGSMRRFVVELLKAKRQFTGETCVWELNHGPDGRVRVVPELAVATAATRAARA